MTGIIWSCKYAGMTRYLSVIVIFSDWKYNISMLTPMYWTKEEIPREDCNQLWQFFICPFQDYDYSFAFNVTFTYFMIDLVSIAKLDHSNWM